MKEIVTTQDLASALQHLTDDHRQVKPEDLRYVLYARKSTDEVGKQDRSLGDQIKDCQEKAIREGLNVVEIIQESASAKEPDIRPKFRKMITDLERGKYDAILAWHPNRLARNMRDAGEIIDLLDKYIIRDLKFANFSYNNDASGKMVLGMTFVLSKQYSDNLSDVVMRGNTRHIEDGQYVNKAKHGYTKDKNDHLRPDGRNFVLIQEAFQMRLKGSTTQKITDFLNKEKYSRTNTKKGNTYVSHVTKQMLSKIFKDPVYTGVLKYGKQVVDLTEKYDFVPAVSVPDFMEINKLDTKSKFFKLAEQIRTPEKTKANLLLGRVFCHECGEPKSAGITRKKTKSGKQTNYFYYRCETEGCTFKNKSTRAKVVIDYVLDYLKQQPFSSKESHKHYEEEMERIVKERLRQARSKLGAAKRVLEKDEERLLELKQNIAVERDSQIKEYQKKDIKKTEDKIKQSKQNIAALKRQIEVLNVAPLSYSDFLELFEKVPQILAQTTKMEDLDFLIKKIFSNFTVNQKSVVESTLQTPFRELDSLKRGSVIHGGRRGT